MPHTNGVCYEFGSYRLDVGRRVLANNGEAVPLTPKATEILILLVSRAGELVEKDELINQIWPDSFVEEANITQNIFALRRALGDGPSQPKFIETVVKRGYRFVAAVQTVEGELQETNRKKTPSNASPVIAVLPLTIVTQDAGIDYLADGLTESIINNLSSVSKVRVMSHSAVAHYKNRRVNPKQVGRELGINVIMLGKIQSDSNGLTISVELVDTINGWQLWGAVFVCTKHDILTTQNEILVQLSAALKLSLTGDEEKRITTRYTESGAAYQAYLEGRFHWSRFTRKGIEKALSHFQQAIAADPNYALAYAGIVDCYLRLATNYLPPEADFELEANKAPSEVESNSLAENNLSRVKLRHEWDWKVAEREVKRASHLKADYPAVHQWYAAYEFARRLYEDSQFYPRDETLGARPEREITSREDGKVPQIRSVDLTRSEKVQILCAIAREQLEVSNYDSAKLLLQTLQLDNGWPRLDNLPPQSAGDLLFTLGTLIGNQAASGRLHKRHRHAEALLNGAVAIFEQLSMNNRSAEARIELGRCYYREGLFQMAAESLTEALELIDESEPELKSACLVIFGAIDRETGNLDESMAKLQAALELCIPRTLTALRCHFEFAQIYKALSLVSNDPQFAELASGHYYQALFESEAVGNLAFEANVRNSLGFLLINTNQNSEYHLLRARTLFSAIGDEVRVAGVSDTLARLYLASQDYERALSVIEYAVDVFERNDGEALLAEALTVKGIILSRLGKRKDAVRLLQGARKVAERCGFQRGVAQILCVLHQDLISDLDEYERHEIIVNFNELKGKGRSWTAFFNQFNIDCE